MSGVLLPANGQRQGHDARRLGARLADAMRAGRAFLLIVVVPTLLVAIYYGIFASRQYESSADFVVRRAESAKAGPDVGQMLGFTLGTSTTEGDAYVVQAYLLSHNAVARLRKENDLVGVFARPDADMASRLWFTNPSPEWLLKFYREQVTIKPDDESGITHLTVHTFRPEDSYAIAQKLLQMGEQQVNAINQRTYTDQVSSAKRQFEEAGHQLAEIEAQLTTYRKSHGDVDPADTGKAQVTLVSTLTQSLVAARARLNAMEGAISHSSPQYQAMHRQVATLQAQVDGQSSKIVGADHSIANRLGDYEELVIKRQEIAQVYAVAAGEFKQAQAEAARKQLYLIRVVEPNLPGRSEFPKRFEIVLTVFGTLLMAYGIGWLLWAGIKEHAL